MLHEHDKITCVVGHFKPDTMVSGGSHMANVVLESPWEYSRMILWRLQPFCKESVSSELTFENAWAWTFMPA